MPDLARAIRDEVERERETEVDKRERVSFVLPPIAQHFLLLPFLLISVTKLETTNYPSQLAVIGIGRAIPQPPDAQARYADRVNYNRKNGARSCVLHVSIYYVHAAWKCHICRHAMFILSRKLH